MENAQIIDLTIQCLLLVNFDTDFDDDQRVTAKYNTDDYPINLR